MFPSSSIGNALTTDPNRFNSTHCSSFVFLNFILKKYLRMTLMQSKDNKMYNFLLYIRTIFTQALKGSLKELQECRSLSSIKLL